MAKVRRDELNDLLERFGIELSDRGLQHAIYSIGVLPSYRGLTGGGKTSWYDSIDAWVLAAAYFGRGASWSDKGIRLESMSDTYDRAVKADGAAQIPGFLEDRELGTKLLYMTQPVGGIPLPNLYRCLWRDPSLYELNPFGGWYLDIFLKSYRQILGQTWSRMPLPSSDGAAYRPEQADMLNEDHYLEQLIAWAGAVYEQAGYKGVSTVARPQ